MSNKVASVSNQVPPGFMTSSNSGLLVPSFPAKPRRSFDLHQALPPKSQCLVSPAFAKYRDYAFTQLRDKPITAETVADLATKDLGEYGRGYMPAVVIKALTSSGDLNLDHCAIGLREALVFETGVSMPLDIRDLRWGILQRLAEADAQSQKVADFHELLLLDERVKEPVAGEDFFPRYRRSGWWTGEAKRHRKDISAELTGLWCAYKDLMQAPTDFVFSTKPKPDIYKGALNIRKRLKAIFRDSGQSSEGQLTTKAHISDFVARVLRSLQVVLNREREFQAASPAIRDVITEE